jgi:HD-GYP domain-containing protein (c-di-GMP phosphodiesterase class II)
VKGADVDAVPLIHHHHERWDGHGYPHGVAADSIPRGAAIVGLADAWDSMTTDRPYHRALDRDEAELRRNRGTQFASVVVDAFFRVFERSGAADRDLASSAETVPIATRAESQPA